MHLLNRANKTRVGLLASMFYGVLGFFGLISLFCAPLIKAQEVPQELKEAGITEHLGDTLTIKELQFKNEAGEKVSLEKYFSSGRPVLLTLVYYECPNLCNFMLNGLVGGLKRLDWTPGRQFDIVTVSIDAREGPELAAAKKRAYLKSYGRPEAESGWHFLTGDEASIQALAKQVGFGFKYDKKAEQFAHSAAIFALTPGAKISRYLYGIEYRPTDLKLSLLEASDGKVGNVVEKLLMFCYRYDPDAKGYAVYAMRLVQASSLTTIALVGGYLSIFWRRQRKDTRRS